MTTIRMQMFRGQGCAGTLFSDNVGHICELTESRGWSCNPMIFFGVHGCSMVLTMGQVRALLPHLQTFEMTGQMLSRVEEDYCI